THGARKGLADTALKTADAGYLTRRLVDVSQDVIVHTQDCGTLRGLTVAAVKNKEEIVSSLTERILGRVTVHDVYHPLTGEIIIRAGEEICEEHAIEIEKSPLEEIEVRSVLTCEAKNGICAKCYGRNLATGQMVQIGEATGVIAAQSIGEPGTQLTLRTFHHGGTAGNIATDNSLITKYDGKIEFDELRVVDIVEEDGKSAGIVISRTTEMRVIDEKTGIILMSQPIPYAAKLFVKNGGKIKKGTMICSWDPYNHVIISELAGKVSFENVIEGVTVKKEHDEQTGMSELIITETKDKTKIPSLQILNSDGVSLKNYNLPVGAHISITENQEVKMGEVLVKIPRSAGKAGDITGGLPRITELFEARNPSNPAVVAEIDGEVTFGKIKRGNREIIVTARTGEIKKYLVNLSKQILVQENDYIRAGMPLSDGAITPADILAIKGPTQVQDYIVNEVQEVYRLQGVKINDKHFEVIVRQMMRKVDILESGDTIFMEKQIIDKHLFMAENDNLWGMKVVENAGGSNELKPGQIISARRLRDENTQMKRQDLALIEARDAVPATGRQMLQGITRAALQTKSFMSAASFQETTKVLNEAAIRGKVDLLEGLKENVICGHLIPAGTGQRDFNNIVVGSQEEYDDMMKVKQEAIEKEA
nr:DNA-directed RNA polymerase subunit beta' [Bacteroidales bacterium]